jgi:mannosyltransferase
MVNTRSRQKTLVLLALPTAAAAVLVLWGIGRESLWRDEVASVTITGRSLGSLWHVIVHHESNMALFDAVLFPWQLLGHGDGFLRLPSAVFAIATVPVTMLVARRIAGDAAAAVAGVVLALNVFLMAYGQQVRGYALTMLLAALAALLLLRAMEGRRRRDWVLWTASIAALPYAHVLGILIVVGQVASLAFYPWQRLPVRDVAAGLAAATVLWLPLALFMALGDHNRTSWVPPLGRDLLRQTVERLAGDLTMFALIVVAALVVLGALAAARRTRDDDAEERWHLALALCWLVVPPVLLGIICFAQQTWVDRYLIGILPAFGVVSGVAVGRLRAHVGMAAAAALAAVLTVGALHAAIGQPHPAPGGEDLRGAAFAMAARTQPGDAIVYAPAFARVGIAYYLDRAGRPVPHDLALAPGQTAQQRGDLFAGERAPADVARRMHSARRLWVVGYGFGPGWHPTPEPVIAVGPAILREDFRPVGRWSYGEVTVQLYRR